MIKPQWDWALANLKNNRNLVIGVVVLVAIGVGASVSAMSVLNVLTQDPIPQRSSSLFSPKLDPRPSSEAAANSRPPKLLSWTDATKIVELGPPDSVVMTAAGRAKVEVPGRQLERVNLRYANTAFFSAFGTAFGAGSAWTPRDDIDRSRLAVLSASRANELFPTESAVGRQILLNDVGFTVVGVIQDWQPKPRFYDLGKGGFNSNDDIYLPVSTALDVRLPVMANFECWADGETKLGDLRAASCGWLSVWVYLPTEATQAAFREQLMGYASLQHDLGRFELPQHATMQSVRDFLSSAGLVSPDVALQTYLALGLLAVCLINASILLLSLSLRRRREFALRRALGAAQVDLTVQALFEGSLIGLLAGLVAAAFSVVCLERLSQLPTLYNTAIRVDAGLLAVALIASVVAAVIASMLPAWVSARAKPLTYLNAE